MAQGPGSEDGGRGGAGFSGRETSGSFIKEVVPGGLTLWEEGDLTCRTQWAVGSALSELMTVPAVGELGLRVQVPEPFAIQRRKLCPEGKPRAWRHARPVSGRNGRMPGQEACFPHPPPRSFHHRPGYLLLHNGSPQNGVAETTSHFIASLCPGQGPGQGSAGVGGGGMVQLSPTISVQRGQSWGEGLSGHLSLYTASGPHPLVSPHRQI